MFRLRKLVRAAGREALILWFAVRDPGTPIALRIAAFAALGYLFSPLDLLPDVPLLGWVDDLLVVSMGLPALIRRLPPDVRARATRAADRVLRALASTPWSPRGETQGPAPEATAARRRARRTKPAFGTLARRVKDVSDAKLVRPPLLPRRRA